MGDAQAGFDERVETFGDQRRVKFGEQPLHESEVDRADNVTVLGRGFPKRAVVQQDLALATYGGRLGGEPNLVEHADQLPGCLGGVSAPIRRRPFGKVATPGGPGLQGGLGRAGYLGGDVAGEDLGEQPVVALAGAGAAGSRGVQGARPPWPVAVFSFAFDQPGIDEPVEVKPRSVWMQAQQPRHVVDRERAASVVKHGERT